MKKNIQGFALFAVLIAVTLVAIVGVVAYVAITKPGPLTGLPSPYVPVATRMPSNPDTVPLTTPTPSAPPTVSTSTDLQVIGKELDDTKVDSVDADMNAMNSSASSL